MTNSKKTMQKVSRMGVFLAILSTMISYYIASATHNQPAIATALVIAIFCWPVAYFTKISRRVTWLIYMFPAVKDETWGSVSRPCMVTSIFSSLAGLYVLTSGYSGYGNNYNGMVGFFFIAAMIWPVAYLTKR